MREPIRVVLVDDHPVVRGGLRAFLSVQPDMTVVGETDDAAESVAFVEAGADVVLLDLKMPKQDGVEVLRALRAASDTVKVIVLTSVSDPARVRSAMAAGAAGFLYKDIDPDGLAQAVRSVHDGQILFAPEAAAAMVAPAAPRALLTARERQVLDLLATGLTNRQIAARLSVTEKTVKTHVSAVFRKLGVADRTQAALYAVSQGWTTPQ
ncbi:response regulator [Stackebrandtia soli]|uniref:response regulator n=1 Tax=Stackebrandtia soli TaxID=1892856 RepID=UPI0039EC199E